MLSSHPDLSPTYGALLIGVLFAAFFQGILTVQVYHYYQYFTEDPRSTKVLVLVLWTLDFIHLILISSSIYYYLVTSWGNIHGIMRMILPFSFHLFPIAFTTLLSQLFFLNRIWIFSQRNSYIVGPILVCCLANFGLIFSMGIMTTTGRQFLRGIIPMLLFGATTDILIASLLCYYVRKRSEGTRDMRKTSTLVTQVIRYTVATSAFTCLLILACLVAYIATPFTFIFIAFHFSSGRTYANAVLVNLNARRQFRETLDSIEPSFAKSIEFSGISSAIRRLPRLQASTQGQSSHILTTSSRSRAGENKFESLVQVPQATYALRSRHSLP